MLAFPEIICYNKQAVGGIAQLGERMTGSHEVSGSIPLISTKTKSHSVRNGFFVLAGYGWREKRCGSTECIFAAQKRRFFCMQCRKHKKMQSARRMRSRRSIPLIVPLSFLEKRMHFLQSCDLTQIWPKRARKRSGFIEIYLTKQHEYTIFQSFSEYFNGGCKLQPPLRFLASDRVSDGVSNRVRRALFHPRC